MKTKMNKTAILYIFLIGLIAVNFSSCKTPKTTETSEVKLEKTNKEDRFKRILNSGIQYTKLSSNLKFTANTANREQSVDAQLRIIKNEAIQLSLLMPLIKSELMKIIITPSQVIVIDRLNKQYLQENINVIKRQMPVDFDYYSLEALLSNRMFISGQRDISSQNVSLFSFQENDYLVKLSRTDNQAVQYIFTSDHTDRIQSILMNQSEWETKLMCEYTNWGLTSEKNNFPMLMKFTLETTDKLMKVDLDFKSVNSDINFTVDNSIPNRYKQITFHQLLNIIGRLL